MQNEQKYIHISQKNLSGMKVTYMNGNEMMNKLSLDSITDF